METSGYNAVPVSTGNKYDVYMEDNNSQQHEKDSVVLTGVKQKQDQEDKARLAFPMLRLAPPFTTQV